MSALGRKQTLGGLQPDCARPLLAQLDRAPGFEPGGWGFKSLGAGHRNVRYGWKADIRTFVICFPDEDKLRVSIVGFSGTS